MEYPFYKNDKYFAPNLRNFNGKLRDSAVYPSLHRILNQQKPCSGAPSLLAEKGLGDESPASHTHVQHKAGRVL